MSSSAFFELSGRSANFDAQERSRRANRRRLIVFASVFAAVALIGLVWVFSRPAIFQAAARLQFVPAVGSSSGDIIAPSSLDGGAPVAADDPQKRYSLRDEVQFLTSTALLSKVWDGLKDAPQTPQTLRTGDPATTLQSMLTATQVPGTNIVMVQARGAEPAFLPLFVDRLVAAYRDGLGARYETGSATSADEARDEVHKLEAAVTDKRREVDAFRAKNNIVSLERDENQVLSEVKGVGTALNLANEKLVAAEAKVGALREAEAAGQSVSRSKDNPTLAALEQQAASIRADLRETARTFTADYMAIDPRVKSQRARLADLEEQIVAQRQAGQQNALQEARQDLASAKAAVAALRQQLVTNQGSVQTFTSSFNRFKALQQETTHLEQLRQRAVDRLATLEAGERTRMPKVDVVEAASLPQSPSSPQYGRDAALAVLAALVAGLLTMGIVEFFNRPPQQASTVVVPQQWSPSMATAIGGPGPMALPSAPSYDALTHEAARAALPGPQSLPRELTTAELVALLGAADRDHRAVMGLLLMGLTPTEIVGLRRDDVDRATATVRVTGVDARLVTVPAHVIDWLPEGQEPVDAPLMTALGGRPLVETDLDTPLLYAAHDAGLDDADDVTPQTLRHTYIAYLVRQGLRFADLARLVGRLPADRLAAYKRLAPPAGSTPPSQPVDLVLPGIRGLQP